MTAADPDSSTIPDTHHDCVLQAFLQGHTIPDLAEHYKLPITAIVAFLNSSKIQSLRDDIARLAASQAELATTHARTAAILTLHAVIDGQSIDPAQVRAASSLLRTTPKAPSRTHHATASSSHVSNGPASQPHDAAHSSPHADVRPNARTDSLATCFHEPEHDAHPEPIAERDAVTGHNDPGASCHAHTEHADTHSACHESPADATASDAQHDHATHTANSRDRPKAAA